MVDTRQKDQSALVARRDQVPIALGQPFPAGRYCRGFLMVTSAECRVRAKQKLADANLHPRHERRLRSAAEEGLILADLIGKTRG